MDADLVGPLIMKKNAVMHSAIPARERVALTLQFLATGEQRILVY